MPKADTPLPCVIVQLGRLVERRMTDGLRPHGITASQLMVMIRIEGTPGVSRADLGRSLQVTAQAAGALTSILIEKGLIVKSPVSPGRPVEFGLTPEGSQLLLKAYETVVAEMREELSRSFRPNFAAAMDGGIRHVLTRLS